MIFDTQLNQYVEHDHPELVSWNELESYIDEILSSVKKPVEQIVKQLPPDGLDRTLALLKSDIIDYAQIMVDTKSVETEGTVVESIEKLKSDILTRLKFFSTKKELNDLLPKIYIAINEKVEALDAILTKRFQDTLNDNQGIEKFKALDTKTDKNIEALNKKIALTKEFFKKELSKSSEDVQKSIADFVTDKQLENRLTEKADLNHKHKIADVRGLQDALNAAGNGAVDSVNSQTGVVVLDADDIDDTSTTNKFVTAADITKLGNLSGTNTGDQDLSGLQPLDSDLTAIAGLADPNADRILFWDDSANTYAYLAAGTGLSITGTTITATGGAGSTYFNNEYIDQSGGTSDTYGVLAGLVNGSNKIYTVSQSVYSTGTLKVYVNGQLQTQGSSEDWVETTPASGTFTFATAPETGDLITVTYQSQVLSSDVVVVTTGAQTLEDKRIKPRTGTVTSSATPTINTDNVDYYDITALAVNITSMTTNLSGTPTLGQKLIIAIKGTGARTITWGASFEASTVALPTTTVSTDRLMVGFIYTGSIWTCVAAA